MKPNVPGIDQLVSRQVSAWLEDQKARSTSGKAAESRPGPYVTISRQVGSGGESLARRLAERLGWTFYDKALLETMSKRTQTSSEVLDALESGAHGALHEAITMTLNRHYPGHHVYLKAMVASVAEIGTSGRAVILGRGANYLLPPEHGVRVRMIAPLEYRLKNAQECHGLEAKQATAWLQEREKNQQDLVRKTLHRDLDDPSSYDVVVNMGGLTERCVEELVVVALKGKGYVTP